MEWWKFFQVSYFECWWTKQKKKLVRFGTPSPDKYFEFWISTKLNRYYTLTHSLTNVHTHTYTHSIRYFVFVCMTIGLDFLNADRCFCIWGQWFDFVPKSEQQIIWKAFTCYWWMNCHTIVTGSMSWTKRNAISEGFVSW